MNIYKRTKPHLDQEEINFIMEDNFKIDEDVDDERDSKEERNLLIKKKLLKLKAFWKKQRVNTTKKSS